MRPVRSARGAAAAAGLPLPAGPLRRPRRPARSRTPPSRRTGEGWGGEGDGGGDVGGVRARGAGVLGFAWAWARPGGPGAAMGKREGLEQRLEYAVNLVKEIVHGEWIVARIEGHPEGGWKYEWQCQNAAGLDTKQ
jgi:hypothetical protein